MYFVKNLFLSNDDYKGRYSNQDLVYNVFGIESFKINSRKKVNFIIFYCKWKVYNWFFRFLYVCKYIYYELKN